MPKDRADRPSDVSGGDIVRIGDQLQISVEVIRQWAEADAGFQSPVVRVKEIRRNRDGLVELWVEKAP
jgi:hypothetical protein